jgi:ABC-type phosphonate transport system ATPase subunit
MGDSIGGTACKESRKTLWVRVRNGIVHKKSRRTLRVRVRAGRAQQMGERALRSSKTAGGASWVRVRSEAWDGPQRGEGDSICKSEACNSL